MGFERYEGGGVCDVCCRPLAGNPAWKVPNEAFYASPKYRAMVEELAAAFGMTGEEYIRRMRAQDASTYSAVCGDCLPLFEEPRPQNASIPRPPAPVQPPASGQQTPAAPVGELDKPVPQAAAPVVPALQSASPAPVKKTLRGFPKGWTIFWIVVNCAAAVVNLQTGMRYNLAELGLLVFLLCGAVVMGLFLMLYKKPAGLYVVVGANLLALLLNGTHAGGYAVTLQTGLVPALFSLWVTWWQIDYGFNKRKKEAPAVRPVAPPATPRPTQPSATLVAAPLKPAARQAPALPPQPVAVTASVTPLTRRKSRAWIWAVVGGGALLLVVAAVILLVAGFLVAGRIRAGNAGRISRNLTAPPHATEAASVRAHAPAEPETGILLGGGSGVGILVRAEEGQGSQYVRFESLVSGGENELGELVLAAYVRDGEELIVALPPGLYRVKFATGDDWRNGQELFGPDGRYRAFIPALSLAEGKEYQLFLPQSGEDWVRDITLDEFLR